MGNGIYTALSGAMSQARTLEVVSNNLANVSTPGYKAGRISFKEVLAKATNPASKTTDSFAQEAAVKTDLRQGLLRGTQRPLDVALEGPGYLAVQSGGKELYSRGGRLRMMGSGQLTDAGGRPVLGAGGQPLRLNPGADLARMSIDDKGTIALNGVPAGKLRLVEFPRAVALKREGGGLYSTGGAGAPTEASATLTRQGFLEGANVNLVQGISSMIVASRTYEAFHRVISTFREVDTKVSNTLGADK